MSKILATAAITVGAAAIATVAYNVGLVVQHNRDTVAIKAAANDILETILKTKSNAN